MDNGTSSSSESESSVGACNCDSVLEDLEDWYTKLQPLGRDLHYEQLPDDSEDQRRYFEQTWDFSFTGETLHQMSLLSIDEEHYYALSELPLTYPWPSITIDLKDYIPFLERHLIAHLVGGLCQVLGRQTHAHTVLDSLLRNLAEAIVNGIFAQHTSNYAPPHLPPSILTPRFWHAHLNNAFF